MKYIVYDNVGDRQGYAMYARSNDFPEKYVAPITQICEQYTDCGTQESVSIRCAPLNERYLVSVIFRRPRGSAVQRRGHFSIVNMLLDNRDRETFFSKPFSSEDQVKKAEKYYHLHLKELGRDPGSPQTGKQGKKTTRPCQLEDRILLEAARYGCDCPVSSQLFVRLEGSADEEIRRLIQLTPAAMCRKLSFHTNILGESESHDIALCFFDPGSRSDLRSWKDGGPANTEKATLDTRTGKRDGFEQDPLLRAQVNQMSNLVSGQAGSVYPFLREAVTSWEMLLDAAKSYAGDKNLKDALLCIPEELICRTLQQKRCSGELLDAVQQALPYSYRNANDEIVQQKRNFRTDAGEQTAEQAKETSAVYINIEQENAGMKEEIRTDRQPEEKGKKPKVSFRERLVRLGTSPLVSLLGLLLTLTGFFIVISWVVDAELVREAGTFSINISLGAVIVVAQALALFVLGFLAHMFAEGLFKRPRRKNR